jgi:Rad3-related DNA helicase
MGQVVVLDPRIVSKPYGKRFLAALPPGVKAQIVRPEPVRDEYQGGFDGRADWEMGH